MLDEVIDQCYKASGRAHSTAVRIYNIIREVGRGELSADNALHQLVEDYHNLQSLGDDIGVIAENLEALNEQPKQKEVK